MTVAADLQLQSAPLTVLDSSDVMFVDIMNALSHLLGPHSGPTLHARCALPTPMLLDQLLHIGDSVWMCPLVSYGWES